MARPLPPFLWVHCPSVGAIAQYIAPFCSADPTPLPPARRGRTENPGPVPCTWYQYKPSSVPADSDVVLIGSGGHTRSVLMALQAGGRRCAGIYTNLSAHVGREILGVPVAGLLSDVPVDAVLHIALGDPSLKRKILSEFPNRVWATIVHPRAAVHESVTVGEGSFVGANVHVEPLCSVGAHSILSAGVVIGHDSKVGSFTLFGANSCSGGAATTGDDCVVGMGAAVSPKTELGHRVILGTASGAHTPIPEGCTAIGIPATFVTSASKPLWSATPLQSVLQSLSEVLGLEAGANITSDQDLASLGLDSIMGIEFTQRLSNCLGTGLPTNLHIRYPTVSAIVQYLESLSLRTCTMSPAPRSLSAPLCVSRPQPVTIHEVAWQIQSPLPTESVGPSQPGSTLVIDCGSPAASSTLQALRSAVTTVASTVEHPVTAGSPHPSALPIPPPSTIPQPPPSPAPAPYTLLALLSSFPR